MATKTNSKVAYTVECPQYGRIVCEAGVKLTGQAGPGGFRVKTWKTWQGAEKEAGRLNGGPLYFKVFLTPDLPTKRSRHEGHS